MNEFTLHYDMGQQIALRTGEIGFVTEAGVMLSAPGMNGTFLPRYYIKTKFHPNGFWALPADIVTERWPKYKIDLKPFFVDDNYYFDTNVVIGIVVAEAYENKALIYIEGDQDKLKAKVLPVNFDLVEKMGVIVKL